MEITKAGLENHKRNQRAISLLLATGQFLVNRPVNRALGLHVPSWIKLCSSPLWCTGPPATTTIWQHSWSHGTRQEVTSTVYKTAQHKHHHLLLVASRHLKQMHPASWLYCARVYFALKTASRKCNTIIPELIWCVYFNNAVFTSEFQLQFAPKTRRNRTNWW